MRAMRSSISRCRFGASGSAAVATRVSVVTRSAIARLAPHAREHVLEAEERREARRLLETTAVERARVLEEIHRAGRRVVETPAEELTEERARDRLGKGECRAAGLADRHLERHGARARHVEHAVRA